MMPASVFACVGRFTAAQFTVKIAVQQKAVKLPPIHELPANVMMIETLNTK
jgi:hypothetical protein